MALKLYVCFLLVTFNLAYGNGSSKAVARDFSFASMFQNNMVLQREPTSAVIWGFGDLGAEVTVNIGNEVYSTSVVENLDTFIWKVNLNPQSPGGPHTIKATQTNEIGTKSVEISNVLFGDVWLCSGQSNMAVTVNVVENPQEEIDAASNYPDIRVMTVNEVESASPQIDLPIRQRWTRASPESIGGYGPATWDGFSAVCWFFGRDLHDRLQVPIGLIAATWGGTTIEPWTSTAALERCNLIQNPDDVVEPPSGGGFYIPTNYGSLWNSMIYPLTKLSIKGIVWYQGESNTGISNYHYSCSFPAMIEDWRRNWLEGTESQTQEIMPFGFVQISTVLGTDTGLWPLLRWRQTAEFGYVPNTAMPNTFMATAIDLGDLESPHGSDHPRYKQYVSARLVTGALQTAYGLDTNPQGPIPVSAIRQSDSNNVLLTYPDDQILVWKENSNFEVCCNWTACLFESAYNSYNWNSAEILTGGSDDHHLEINGTACDSPQAHAVMVRYAWALSPCELKSCSVYNDKGLPSPPFVMRVA